MKIAYCGYDFFQDCLRELLRQGNEVIKVFTFDCDNRFNFNRYIYGICEQHQIPISQDPISPEAVQLLVNEGCELIITAGYRHKVPDLNKVGLKGINVHPALLPQGRGVWPLPWIVLKQHSISGVTIHKLSNEFDAGDILLQNQFEIHARENLETLSCKMQMQAIPLINQAVQNLDQLWGDASPQDEAQASLWPMPQRKDRLLDWTKPVEELDRTTRAFGKFGAIAYFDNNWWYVYNINVWQQQHHYSVGDVVHKTNTEMVVAASDGLVCLRLFDAVANTPN